LDDRTPVDYFVEFLQPSEWIAVRGCREDIVKRLPGVFSRAIVNTDRAEAAAANGVHMAPQLFEEKLLISGLAEVKGLSLLSFKSARDYPSFGTQLVHDVASA
jgi:hypothetical protein